MATDKPRFTLTIPDEILARVERYQTARKLKTKSKAIQRLIEIGLEKDADTPHGTKYQALSPLETRYRALDPHSRKVVDAVMELEAERFAREIITPEKPKTRVIPLFIAAAGPGEPVNGIFEEHEIPYEKKGEFAVKVSGDSMEPELKDGEIVLCMKRPPKNGELGVIMVNGSLLVKQVITAGGDIYLRSLNRARKNLDVDLFESGNDTVACYGTVIHRHVPLVMA